MSKIIVPERKLLVGGRFSGHIERPAADCPRWRDVVETFDDPNLVVYEGIDDMLAVYLCGSPQTSNWYLGLYTNNYAPVPTDKAATISARASEFTGYQPATRPAYSPTEGAQQATNSAGPATFTFTSAATIFGAFLISSSQKSSGSGKLLAAALFATPKQVGVNDQLLLTYTIALQAV